MSDPAIRVLTLLSLYPPDFSGWGIQWQRLLPHLRAQGVDPQILVRRPFAGVDFTSGSDEGVEVLRPAHSERFGALRGAALLHRYVHAHRHDFDVVHSICFGMEFFALLPYLRWLGKPLVLEMILLGGDDPVSLANSPRGGLKRRLLTGVDHWVGISEGFRPSVLEAGVPEERFSVIHPGVDVERYRPADAAERAALRGELGIAPDGRVVVSVGSLLERKGMDRLIRAWARTGPRRDRDALLLVGPSCEAEGLRPEHLGHVSELRRLAAGPELAGTVRLLGRLDDVDRPLRAADAFALLSRREGFGTVTAEAMACGLPVLVTALDGIGREIVDEGETGFVFDEPLDEAAVAARLGALLAHPELGRSLGERGAARARARFSFARRAEALRDLYAGMLAERAGRD